MGIRKEEKADKLVGLLPMASREIWSKIPYEVRDGMTAKQLAFILDLYNRAYHAGRASTGADVIDDSPSQGAVWVNCLKKTIEWVHQDGTLIVRAL